MSATWIDVARGFDRLAAMQDRYAFDIGDFSKCGLLRALMATAAERRLGVIWYANEPDGREVDRNDGKHVTYLAESRSHGLSKASEAIRRCDPELFDAFREAVARGGARSIAALERLAPWPQGTCFYSARTPRRRVVSERSEWFRRAMFEVAGSDLICCDPDNGMARSGFDNESRPSPKHMLHAEASAIVGQGASAVLYHHFDRSMPHGAQARNLKQRLDQACAPATVSVVRYRRISPRAYAIVVHPRHASWLDAALDRFKRSLWFTAGHFSA